MNNVENVMIYPYGIEFAPILRHRGLCKNYNIVGVVSPPGFGITGLDAGTVDGGISIGINVCEDFDEVIDNCDTLILANCLVDMNYKEKLIINIKKAVFKNKNIICTMQIEDHIKNKLINECSNKGLYFKYLFNTCDKFLYNNVKNESIEDIKVPIIFIIGLSEFNNKYEIQLALRENIIKRGYKVSQIGTRPYSELLGFHSFPMHLFRNNISEIAKIVSFNHFVKHIERIEEPDLLIIGIPGGIMPYNKKFTNGFGVLAYLVSQAVNPDFVITSVLYNNFKASYFDMLNTSIKYKFGYEIDCFNIANAMIDYDKLDYYNEMPFNILDSYFIDVKKQSICYKPLYNIMNSIDAEKIVDLIIDTLSSPYSFNKLSQNNFYL